MKIEDHDLAILFGDFNFRVDMDFNEVKINICYIYIDINFIYYL